MATNAVTRAGKWNTVPWPNAKNEKIFTMPGSDLRQLEIQVNKLANDLIVAIATMTGDAGCITTSTPSKGTTVTIACSASIIQVAGVHAAVAAETAKAFGSLGTIPNNMWGLIVLERVAAGTTTFVSAAANYTTGYDTEALAIAAMPARTANKAAVGYITVQAAAVAAGWIAGTDALAGGTGGTNPAQTTNYYPVYGVNDALFPTAYQIANAQGTVLSAQNY